MLSGAGANITMSVGEDGVLMVDAGKVETADKVLELMRQIQQKVNQPGKPIRYIVDTTLDSDHTGGNATISSKGLTVMQAL